MSQATTRTRTLQSRSPSDLAFVRSRRNLGGRLYRAGLLPRAVCGAQRQMTSRREGAQGGRAFQTETLWEHLYPYGRSRPVPSRPGRSGYELGKRAVQANSLKCRFVTWLVFKTRVRRAASLAGSTPVRLRHQHPCRVVAAREHCKTVHAGGDRVWRSPVCAVALPGLGRSG